MKQTLMSFLRCTAFTLSGYRCKFKAKYGSKCGVHR